MPIGRGDARERAERWEVARIFHPPKLGLRGPQTLRGRALRESGAAPELADRPRDGAGERIGRRHGRRWDRLLLGLTHPEMVSAGPPGLAMGRTYCVATRQRGHPFRAAPGGQVAGWDQRQSAKVARAIPLSRTAAITRGSQRVASSTARSVA